MLVKIIKSLLPYGLVKAIQRNRAGHTLTLGKFQKAFKEKSKSLEDYRFTCKWQERLPCLEDATSETAYDPHYIYHPAWAARILATQNPVEHVDIGSSLTFVSLVSAFIPVKFYDYRPAPLRLTNFESGHADLLKLPFADNSVESLSCMHVVEHIGLERYGDPFDPKGDLKAISELSRVVKPTGTLLFVVPIAETPRIQYNAHRIYSFQQVTSAFAQMQLHDFSFITDNGEFVSNAKESDTLGQQYGCGCFCFRK